MGLFDSGDNDMKNKPLEHNVRELKDILIKYVNARIDLWKMSLLEKIVKANVYFMTHLVLVLLFSFVLLFLTFAFGYWFGNNYGSLSLGFLIAAGFILLVSLIIYLLRKHIFSGSAVRNLASVIFPDEEKNDHEYKDSE